MKLTGKQELMAIMARAEAIRKARAALEETFKKLDETHPWPAGPGRGGDGKLD